MTRALVKLCKRLAPPPGHTGRGSTSEALTGQARALQAAL